MFVFTIWARFHETEVNIFYASIRTTETYQFDKFRTAGVTGNAIINSQGQGNNRVCSTRDEISQPSLPFSPRAATVANHALRHRQQKEQAFLTSQLPRDLQPRNAVKLYGILNYFPVRSTGYCKTLLAANILPSVLGSVSVS